MPEKVTISHRGAKYEIGRGKRYYGIWVTGAPESDPIDRWPETREGWTQAWTRFAAIETPGTITAAERPRAGLKLPRLKTRQDRRGALRPARDLAGAGLVGLGVLLGLIGLFPGYIGSASLASQASQLVPHLCYLAGWTASAALIVLGVRSRPSLAPIGALLGIGVSAVTFGLFFADLGQVISGGAGLLGAGLVLSLLSWAACTAGAALAFTARPRGYAAGGPGRPRGHHAGPIALLVLGAIGAAATFIPSWDSYTLTQASTGTTQTITAGNVFANPGPVIAGDILVEISVVAVAVLAALWRPARLGAVLLAGAIIPLAAQAISALIQVSGPVAPSMFGISQAQASAAGLTITSGVTPIFWVYCAFVISLLISCAWMFTAPQYPAMPVAAEQPSPGPVEPSQSEPAEAGDSRDSRDSDDGAAGDEESTYA